MDQPLARHYKNTTKCLAVENTISLRAYKDYPRLTCCCNLDNSQAGPYDTAFLERIKSELSSGIKPTECNLCWEVEDKGQISERLRLFINSSVYNKDYYSLESEPEQYQISVKFGNQCPLYCRTCYGNDSSSWAEITKTHAQVPDTYYRDLSEDPTAWQFLTQHIVQSVKRHDNVCLTCIGGETVVQPGFFRLLDWVEENNFQSRLMIRLTTSFTSGISEHLLDRLVKFKNVSLLLSIDSVKENYELVRHPAKFDKIVNNLDKLSDVYNREAVTDLGKFDLWVTPVFSLNNVFYIEEYISWWQSWIKRKKIFPKFSNINLHYPRVLMVETLPMRYRPELIALLEKCLDYDILANANFIGVKLWIESCISTLSTCPEDINLFHDFLRFTADFDRRSGIISTKYNSKLFDLLTKEDRDIYDQCYTITDIDQPIKWHR